LNVVRKRKGPLLKNNAWGGSAGSQLKLGKKNKKGGGKVELETT